MYFILYSHCKSIGYVWMGIKTILMPCRDRAPGSWISGSVRTSVLKAQFYLQKILWTNTSIQVFSSWFCLFWLYLSSKMSYMIFYLIFSMSYIPKIFHMPIANGFILEHEWHMNIITSKVVKKVNILFIYIQQLHKHILICMYQNPFSDLREIHCTCLMNSIKYQHCKPFDW